MSVSRIVQDGDKYKAYVDTTVELHAPTELLVPAMAAIQDEGHLILTVEKDPEGFLQFHARALHRPRVP